MPTIVHTVAGAAQFTGLANAGLVQFPTQLDGLIRRPVIYSFSFFTTVAVTTATLDILDPATATAIQRVRAFVLADSMESFYFPCKIVVPNLTDTSLFYQVVFVTTGKTATGTFICDWNYAPQGEIP